MPPHTPDYIAAKKAEGHGMSILQDYMAAAPWPAPTSLSFDTSHQPGNSRSMNKTVEPFYGVSPWSTPRASDGEKGSPNQSCGAGGTPLPAQMHQAVSPWATPSVVDATNRGYQRSGGNVLLSLPGQMAEHLSAPRASPSARDWKDTPGMSLTGPDGRNRTDQLPRQMSATEPSGPAPTGSSATTEKPAGSPTPAHPCWLQGYPAEWLHGAVSATQSSRRSPRKSSPP